ncbi:MAG TPA: SPFH domain-containing protein [Anaerolineales bacterium]|nr:SPFH domain-containing protein [Anaerolineales bacterium]
MSSLLNDIGKWWLEFRGRKKKANRYPFPEKEIVSVPYPRNVSVLWNATYLNLHPTHYAVAIGPDGRLTNLKGGYYPLPPGQYTIHYIDKQNRLMNIPRTGETTYDGFQVGLELVITYRVIDPVKALEVQQAVETLLGFIQSDLKEFIRSHKYDEIMGDLTGSKLDDEQIIRYIKGQHASRHMMSRLFLVADVVVREKIGDPKITAIREKYQINQRQFAAQSEIQRQNQELEQKVASQEATIKKIKAESEVNQQRITQEMEMQKIELEKARAEFKFKQEQWTRAMDAIAQAFSSQTYPWDPKESEIIRDLLSAMSGHPVQIPGAPAGSDGTSNKGNIDELTTILLNLRKRNPS